MVSGEIERMSMLLSAYLDRTYTGTREEVAIIRRALTLYECLNNVDKNSIHAIQGGSFAEGLCLMGSDIDEMIVDTRVVVTYLDQCIPVNMPLKTILYIREAESCRPGYVKLELGQFGEFCDEILLNSLVTVGNSLFISSDIYRENYVSFTNEISGWTIESCGPSCSSTSISQDTDTVHCFSCNCWPKEANEWITRERLYGWPPQNLMDKIVESGCHLVPVGDKCSPTTLLQWRISFSEAEISLIHSFSHIQLKVYTLLKYFLKQIKAMLKETIGDDDILSSYIIKTILFHAIENSNQMFWEDKNLFYCFWFCFNILIAFARAGFCPHYFIPANNLFKRKVHGQNQQILLDILNKCYQMKWLCLSEGNFFKPSIWEDLCNPSTQAQLKCPITVQEVALKQDTTTVFNLRSAVVGTKALRTIRKAIQLLPTSQSDFDEIYIYHYVTMSLQKLATTQAYLYHTDTPSNKTRYRSLRKCKRWMTPSALMGTEVLNLATFHFLTGNFNKSLQVCKQVIRLASYYTSNLLHKAKKRLHPEQVAMHRQEYQQPGQASDRLQKLYTGLIVFYGNEFSLPHLCLEMSKEYSLVQCIIIPPLPYTLFLNFLCCHELRDTRGRDTALHHLMQIQYHEEQGGDKFWIVHTLLGICYQTLGDYHSAIQAYLESAQSETDFNEWNPAIDRIAIVLLCMYVSQTSDRG